MKVIRPFQAAAGAVAADPRRPATAIVHDSPDVRSVVFRIGPGQVVAPHRSASTVLLTTISGRGIVSGADTEQEMQPGDVVVYEPNELHGMRATDDTFVLLATITPRPGDRAQSAS
ncbi:MAG TPA: cupin domain-containing protein [Gemmatimonadaceae bacterium]|nr:cupin domain-containing protein [Gemmatimonadaceae bacterium]